MKISIVTLSFNQGRFLAAAMDSVLGQGYLDLDYIVVDPGSSDGSRAIIERYRPCLGAVILEPDRGPADGLNHGFAMARGEIFGFLNADDLLRPGALDAVARAFEAHPDADVISGHGHLIDEQGRPIRPYYSDRYSLWRYCHGAVVLLQQSTFFRARAFRAVGGFNIANRTCWDGELWMDLALAGMRFELVPEFWSAFRVYQGSISGSIVGGGYRAAYDNDRRRMFRKATGREPRGLAYKLQRLVARVVKWSLSPTALLARIRSLADPKARQSPI